MQENADDFMEITPTISEPDSEALKEYLKWLGGDLERDQDLMYIAREALLAEIPDGWILCQRKDGTLDPFYFNPTTGESSWDHPLDPSYKEYFIQQKKLKEKNQNQKDPKPPEPKTHEIKKIRPPTPEKANKRNQIKLTSKSLKHFPFQNFEKDFAFVHPINE